MKAILMATTALAGFFALRAVIGNRAAPLAASSPRPEDMGHITRRFLMNAVLPVGSPPVLPTGFATV